jgi:xanthine dehydrogenase accessory factor
MNDWLTDVDRLLREGRELVRVVVSRVQGSAPREAGATMLVTLENDAAQIVGSIGGGHLEWQAMDIARTILRDPHRAVNRLDRFALGATLGQCCGGVVELWFDRFDTADANLIADALDHREHDAVLVSKLHGEPRLRVLSSEAVVAAEYAHAAPTTQLVATASGSPLLVQPLTTRLRPLWLFGAGHVGKALVPMLAGLPFRVNWIDSREHVFSAALPVNVTAQQHDDPVDALDYAPYDALFLVLTHRHDLDYEICRAVLERCDPVWLGLIGSRSKARLFAQRLLRHGLTPEHIARLTCPIGVPGIASKLPAAIAVSVAAQLLEIDERLVRQQPVYTAAQR